MSRTFKITTAEKRYLNATTSALAISLFSLAAPALRESLTIDGGS